MIVTQEEIEKLNLIKEKYPLAYEWIKEKCNYEHYSQGKVLHEYEDYINGLMVEEEL